MKPLEEVLNGTPVEALERSLRLTPQEQRIVQYHRSNLANPGRDEEGRPVTVYSTGITVPEGPHRGKFVSVPGFVNGRIAEPSELYRIWQQDIDAGKWPMYSSPQELNQRSQAIHQIMDMEAQ